MRRLLSLLAGLGLLASIAAAPVAAGGPPSLAFYVDGVRYRTVGTPTDFSGTGAPAHSFDTIYALGRRAHQRRRGSAGRSRLQRWPLDGPADRVARRARAADERRAESSRTRHRGS